MNVVSNGVVSKSRLRLTGCALALAGSIVALAPAGCVRSVLLPILVRCVSLFGVRVTHAGGGAAAECDVDDAGGCVAVVLVVLPGVCWCALAWCDDAIRLGRASVGVVLCVFAVAGVMGCMRGPGRRTSRWMVCGGCLVVWRVLSAEACCASG